MTSFTMVLMLICGASGQNIKGYIKRQFDDLRQSVAKGRLLKLGGGHLPSSSAMFELTEDTQLGYVAVANSFHCIKPSDPHLAKGSSMNFFSINYMAASLTEKELVDMAFTRWKQEPYLYGIGDDVIYNNTNIQNFANAIYYQAIKYGCTIQTCHGPPVTHVFVCVFDKEPVLNAPLYIVSPNKNGCFNNRDCEQALPFAKCSLITRLCLAFNDTNFKDLQSSTTTATLTTVAEATSITGVKSTMEASSTVANVANIMTTTTGMPTTTPAIMSTTTTTTTASMPTTTTTTTNSYGIITEEIRLKIINMHNYRRSRLAQGLVPNGKTGTNLPAGSNIFRMTYSMELERAAQAYANTCPSKGSTSLTTMGENFASISSNTMEVYDCVISAIKSFWSQIRTESINSRVMFTEKLTMRSNGPLKFTQMAWATTHKVGCGAQRCDANTVLVCRYSPRGNIVNQSIYSQGSMCSACPYGGCITDYRQQGLCPAT